MRRLLEWLLDLEAIRLDEGGALAVHWQSAWPAWAVAMAVALLVVWTWRIYRREGGPRWGRWVGGLLRVCLLLLTLGLAFQPLLLLRRTRVEPSQVALLIDDSASMGTSDRYARDEGAAALARAVGLFEAGTGEAPASTRPTTTTSRATSSASADAVGALSRRSRADLVVAGLRAGRGAALRALAARNRLAVYAFAERARLQLPSVPGDALAPVIAWLASFQPSGSQTDLSGAIGQVLGESRAGRLAAIVVFSDGRSTVPGDIDAAVRAAGELQVPVHAILAGSAERRRDIIVGPAVAGSPVFVRDPIAVDVRVAGEGVGPDEPIDVQLLGPDDAVLAEERITLSGEAKSRQVELRHRPDQPGRLRMRVRAGPIAGETNPGNNVDTVEVEVVDEKVKVLYVDGYPRYEYRYLKNMLVREATVTASCLLLSADEGFSQEGAESIRRFPETAEELRPFDVVIFGDVNPRGDWLSPRQMATLVEWVGDRGGGFVMVAGPRWSPQAYLGTPLEKLIPVQIDPDTSGRSAAALTATFQPRLTLAGRRSSVFRFDLDAGANDQIVADLPGMFWYAQTRGAAPGAEVLAEHPTARTVEGAMPLWVTGRYGAGGTAFVGVEETWRWRREVGDALFDIHWLQLIRRLTRGQFLGPDRRFALRADRRQYVLGEPVVLTLSVLDAGEAAGLPDEIPVELVDVDGHMAARVRLHRLGEKAGTYEGGVWPPRAGSFTVRIDGSAIGSPHNPPTAMVHVEASGAELRRLEPDHETLRALARRTGGLAVGLDRINQVAERIEDRSVEIPDDVTEPLWDTKLVLGLFVLIIGVEWILRKALGLV